MRKIRKRVFAAVLAAALLFTMPGMSLYAEAEGAQTEDISESVTVQAEDDAAEETVAETEVIQEPETEGSDTDKLETGEDDAGDVDAQEPAEEETVPTPKEDVKECTCGTLCTQDSINGDCPVCGVEDADLSCCEGEKTENKSEENREDAEQGDTGAQDAGTNLCAHHKEHTQDCGYSPASEDGKGSPCTYECCICPIEDLIAALPHALTEDNRAEVEAQLQEILDLYRELSEDEQKQINRMLCWDLLAALDEANAPTPVEGEVSADYQEASWNGSAVIYTDKTASCTAVTDSTTEWTDGGWYVVTGSVTINQPITVSGNVSLILADGCTLNATQGIVVSDGNSLTIYAQAGGTGTLNATGVGGWSSDIAGAGIGGYGDTPDAPDSGAITIHGGVISATGGVTFYKGAAGIGGGIYCNGNGKYYAGDGKDITIFGGVVTAKASASGGAGIGGACGESSRTGTTTGGSASNINIYGGTVTATGGFTGAGIGGGGAPASNTAGNGTNITISGGIVTATGGDYAAGIGGGGGYKNNYGTYIGGTGTGITITGGIVNATSGEDYYQCGYRGDAIGNGGNQNSLSGATKQGGIIFVDGAGYVHGTAFAVKESYQVPEGYTLWGLEKLTGCIIIKADGTSVPREAWNESLTGPFTLQPCTHESAEYTPTSTSHTLTCPVCGETETAGHTLGADNKCEDCGAELKVQVEIGNATTCYGTIDAAWAAAQGGTATVTLLADVTASDTLTVDAGSTITLTGGDYTLTSGQQTAIQVSGTLKLESGTVKSTCSSSQAKGINVSGTLEMTGGAVTTSENIVSGSMAVRADSGGTITVSGGKISGVYGILVNGGTVTIQNGEISGRSTALDINIGTVTIEGGTFTGSMYYGLNVKSGGTVTLCGGTFTGGNFGCTINSETALSDLLDQTQPSTYYAYFENGKPVALADGQTSLDGGTFTVGECNHEGGVQDNGNGTHSGKCPYCGAELAAAPHTLGDSNKCEGCGTQLKVKVEIGNATTYYGTIDAAWEAVGDKTATITLLDDVTEQTLLPVSSGRNVTLNGGSHTLSIVGFNVYGGQLDITGGTFEMSVPLIVSVGTVRISGDAVIKGNPYGVHCTGESADIQISGGTITGSENAVFIDASIAEKKTVSDLLENYGSTIGTHYAFYQNGVPVTSGLDGSSLPGGTYTVAECTNHVYTEQSYSHTQGAFTHTQTCAACGAVKEVDCYYSKLVPSDGQVPTIACVCGATLTASLTDADNLVYNGKEHKPAGVTFTVDGVTLRDNVANIKTYSSNKEAGTGTIAIMDTQGVYQGFFHLFFPIAQATPVVTWNGGNTQTLDYTGQAAAVTADVQLVNNETGTVSYSYAKQGSDSYTTGLPTDAGTYSVKASFAEQKNYVAADAELTLTISPLAVTVTPDSGQHKEYGADNPKLTYTISPSLIGNDQLTGALTYTGSAVGTYEITQGTLAAPSENYTLTVAPGVMFEITKLSLETAKVSLSPTSFTYDGASKTPTVTVTKGDSTVDAGEYDITYSNTNGENGNHTNAGTVTVTVTAKADGNYHGSCSTTFIINPAALTEAMVALSASSVTYSGTAQEPEVTVKQGNTMLAEGADYDVAYSNTDFTNAGTITVTITGKGNYTGTVETTYTIKKAPLTITASNQTITYGGSITQGADNVTVAGLCTGDVLESITLTASTANVPGGNITPSAAGIKNSGGGDVTGNYEITYKDGRLTINKADTEITVGTNTYNNTFGDAAFTLDVTDNNTEADMQYEVTAGADVISVSNGTVTIRNAGTATITVSLPETANYNAAASRTITVTVAKKGGYSVTEQNRNYLYSRENTGSIDLAALLPKDCGTITYGTPAASGDVTYSVKPAVNDGKLSYTLNSGNKNDEGTITVTVATRNYTDITITVKVKLTDRIPVSLKTGTEVTLKDNVLTYGEPLSRLVFNEAEFVGDDGNTVAGTLAWKDAAATPNAGTTSAVWVFTPADAVYISVEGTATITVNQTTPTVSETPELTDRVYNPSITLKDDDLSSVTVTGVDGKILEGKWSWQSADIVPTVDNSGYEAVFTPKDTTNYETVTRTITVNVTKATPYIAELPAAAAITYGEPLKDSLLSGGTVLHGDGAGQAGDKAGNTETVAGAFTWKEPSAKPAAADSNVTEYTIVFMPSDTANYNSVEAKVKLTVNKAQNAPNMPGSAMSVSNSIEKVGSVPLPAGWEWQVKDTALEAGAAVSAVAVYTGADKGNYENETVTVAITRSSCDHVAGAVLYTGEGEKAPTCTENGLGHRECTVCGAVIESGIVEGALKHTGGTATCSQRAVCTRCNQPYGDTNSSEHGDTEVRGFTEATCTAGGYTGDTYCKDCGAKTKTGSATAALGHNYTSKATTEATTDREGTRTYICSRCGHSYTRPIAKLPGDDTTKPGSSQPGDMEPGSGNTEETGPEPGIPFIKGEDSKTGWEVIRAEEEQAKEGSVINVDMNGTTVVPGDIFDRLRGRDITITFDMGGDIIWSVDGKSVTRDASRDRTGGIDFSVKTGVNAIPVDIVNNVTGESYSIQISLAHEGEFGFTAVLSLNLGKENAGYTASLYYYNQSTGELEFICADEVAEDGTASLAFTHASDYVIAIDGDEEEESGGVKENAQPRPSAGTDERAGDVPESSETGRAGGLWWIIVVILLTAAIGTGTVLAVRKKGKDE